MRSRQSHIGPSHNASGRNRLALMRYSHIVSSAIDDIGMSAFRSASGGVLTRRQIDLLEYIAIADRSIEDAAGFLRVSRTATTSSLSRLERRGYVARSSEGAAVRCTYAGRRVVASYRRLQRQAVEKALESFGEEECAEIARVLERWSLALMSIGDESNSPCLRCDGFYDSGCLLKPTRTCAMRGRPKFLRR